MVVLALYALGNLDFPRATGTWHPLVRYLSRRRSTGKFGVFWETTLRYFYDPLFLTVTCSEFARGVQDYGFFWKMPSGRIPYSILLGFDSGCMSRQFTEAGPDCTKLRILRSCSSSLVIDILFVLRRLIPMVQTIQQIIEILLSPFVFRWSMSPLCGPCSLSGAAVEKTFVLPQLQLVEKLPPGFRLLKTADFQ